MVDAHQMRVYFFFAGYLILLFALRALVKSRRRERSALCAARITKLALASVGVSGAVFIAAVVVALILGGAEAVSAVMSKMIYAVPAIAIVLIPFINKRLS